MNMAAPQEAAWQDKHHKQTETYGEIVASPEFDVRSSEKLRALVAGIGEIGYLMAAWSVGNDRYLKDYHPTREGGVLGIARRDEGGYVVSTAGLSDGSSPVGIAIECPLGDDWQLDGETTLKVDRSGQVHTYTFRRWGDQYVINDGRMLFAENAGDIDSGQWFTVSQVWQARDDFTYGGDA